MVYLISCLCVGSILPYGAYLVSEVYGWNNSKSAYNGSLDEGSQQRGCHSNLSMLVPLLTVLLRGDLWVCFMCWDLYGFLVN